MNEEPQTTQARKKQISRILADIRRVLWEQWDPIGVNNMPEAHDEYDSYAPGVYSLLLKGATDVELADHLRRIEVERMGLIPDPSPQGLPSVISALRSIDLQSP